MIAVIIQARMGSTRLPGKVLKKVNGKPLLKYMVDRVNNAQRIDKVIVATSNDEKDSVIVEICRKNDIECFTGSEDDVLDRYYQCATNFKVDTIVRLTADCPLIDPMIIDYVLLNFLISNYDYVSNDTPPEGITFPDGMDVEVFSYEALQRAWNESKKPSDREHVTFYFWKNPDIFKTNRVDLPFDLSKLRLTVDYDEDFKLIEILFTELYNSGRDFTLMDIVNFLEKNPSVKDLNSHIEPMSGWKPSLERDKKAGFE